MRYEIKNQPFTVLTLHMDAGESIKCQSGAMAWMSPSIRMETKTGGLGGMLKTDFHECFHMFVRKRVNHALPISPGVHQAPITKKPQLMRYRRRYHRPEYLGASDHRAEDRFPCFDGRRSDGHLSSEKSRSWLLRR